jgi:hypothetical protein
VAYKWLGEKVKVMACDTLSERELLLSLHKLMDSTDIIIAHNGDSFDIKKINARFIIHKLGPPSPYRTIDTKKVAKRVAAFDSNSLNNLGLDMGEGEKIKHRGFDMWEGCMAGNSRDWADMKRYNKQDVDLLERVYLRLLPWITNHPGHMDGCNNCGSMKLQSRGQHVTRTGSYHRFQCQSCGAWTKGRAHQ